MTQTTYLQIALPSPLYCLFDYLPPKECSIDQLKPGMRLWVPFRNQKRVGLLINVSNKTDVALDKIRQALEVIDNEPITTPYLLKLTKWVSHYYHYPIGEVMVGTIPKQLRQGKPAMLPGQLFWKLTDAGKSIDPDSIKRAKKQQALMVLLAQHLVGLSEESIQEGGFSKQVINTLENKQWIESFIKEQQLSAPAQGIKPDYQLNTEQQLAIDSILRAEDQFKPFLLKGVTGSGKTEVYLQCIETILQHGKQALVLVPEIGLTPQTVKRFQERFPVPIAVLHSNCSDTERLNAWLHAKSGKVKIIIGTRSAIFTPFLKLGIIFIDEAHDISFKQQDGLRYSARDVSIMRAHHENIPIVLGSATPSFESLVNAQKERYQLLELKHRTGEAKPPSYTIIDVRNQYLQDGFSQSLIDHMQKHLGAGNQVLVFLNRRGFAPTLICHHCGWVASCNHCDARLTLHMQPKHLHCHHCDTSKRVYHACPQCKSDNLLPLGLGTERVENTLEELFPDNEVIRIDRDSTRKKGSLDAILKRINNGQSQLLIGTQMLAKGHHFPNVTLVVILDADGGFFSADFRATERMAQLILQVGGRAGREQKAGEVIIQTHNPSHPQLLCLLQQGYEGFAQVALEERKAASLPPFSHIAILRAESSQRQLPMAFLNAANEITKKCTGHRVQVLGPIPAPMEKRAGRYRAQLLLQSAQRSSLHELLHHLMLQIQNIEVSKKVRWSLDVDPLEMF